ncbi:MULTISPECIES: hypothetical protein [Micrococcaceae]|uniref:hypothetical protein n=1 Tax=Micrococcaceae TaxID=1268 RepID=UPI001036AFEF|nr:MULTISPECIES: hypothetical protein [Micrococcaceae]TAP27512.1 hypothetical protein EYR88_03955 [Arthrobacter sp. S41]UXN30819.1 hypothetical protein N6V40_10230 [Glutamicibacter sp. M10]
MPDLKFTQIFLEYTFPVAEHVLCQPATAAHAGFATTGPESTAAVELSAKSTAVVSGVNEQGVVAAGNPTLLTDSTACTGTATNENKTAYVAIIAVKRTVIFFKKSPSTLRVSNITHQMLSHLLVSDKDIFQPSERAIAARTAA